MTTSTTPITGVDFISIPATDLDRARKFYGEVLGLEASQVYQRGDGPAMGAEFGDVRIEFKGFGDLRAPLAVRYAGEITKGTKQVKRLGCHFTKLSAAQENLVQKFMAHIQREERAKLG